MSLVNAQKTTDYPIQQSERRCTDVVCAFLGLIFSLILILLALFLYNRTHEIRTSFPSDSAGQVCGFDLPQFPYIYFANFPKIDRRVCVSSCPSANATALNCIPTANVGCNFNSISAFYVGFYPNRPVTTMIGSYCEPTSPSLRNQLYTDIGVSRRMTFFNEIGTIIITLLIGLALAILFLFLVQQFPQKIVYAILGAGCVVIVLTVLFVLIFPSSYLLVRILFALLMLLLLVTIVLGWKREKGTFQLYSEFLTYACRMIGEQKILLLYIPLFLLIMALFLFGVAMELRSLWSSSGVSFSQSQVFWQFTGGSTTFWTILVVVQLVWGLAFIKESFNFCISGNTAEWYFSRMDEGASAASKLLPAKYLLLRHLGSVVASSFMSGWFTIADYIFDFLRSDIPPAEGSAVSGCQKCLNCVDNFFDLVRSDCMCYIYLTGNPYCNSARYCEYLCGESALTRNSQSISRFYRICAHFLLAGLMAMINLLLQGPTKSIFILLLVFLLGLFLATFFVSFHADSTESVQIIFLLDEYFAGEEIGQRGNSEGKGVRKEFNDNLIKRMKLQRHRDFAGRIAQVYNQQSK